MLLPVTARTRRVVVFDSETDSLPTKVYPNGWTGGRLELCFENVQATCVCALELVVQPVSVGGGESSTLHRYALEQAFERARLVTCWRDDTTPFQKLLDMFDSADVVVGYNATEFDFPVLKKYYGATGNSRYKAHLAKCHDIFLEIRNATGLWLKLDDLLRFNGLPVKSGRGADAIQLWETNQRTLLAEYCAADVDRTTRLALLKSVKVPGHGKQVLAGDAFNVLGALAAVVACESDDEAVSRAEAPPQ
jgi:hypothetical protein